MRRRPSKIVVRNAIMKHAGLSDFDVEWVDAEVDAIYKALYEQGYKILKGQNG